MIVTRWQAPIIPSKEQVKLMFQTEGLEPQEEHFPTNTVIKEHRHPFDEVRMVVAGELKINVAGNQLLLRAGDRIEISSNTKHEKTVHGSEDCVSIVAFKPPL